MMSDLNKLMFYISLPINKVFGILESNNKIGLLRAELVIMTGNFRNDPHSNIKSPTLVTTKNKDGTFITRNLTIDLVVVSSAFEKQDIWELKKRISRQLRIGKNVLFFDVGASFGKYTISLGRHFRDFKNRFKIFTFEPEPQSFTLLSKNIRINNLKNVTAFNIALSSKSGKQTFFQDKDSHYLTSFPIPGSKARGVKIDRLDRILAKLPRSTAVFIKLDVEGHEIAVLQGSGKLKEFAQVTLLVEDCLPQHSGKLIEYLRKVAKFSTKLTPYNSFWELK